MLRWNVTTRNYFVLLAFKLPFACSGCSACHGLTWSDSGVAKYEKPFDCCPSISLDFTFQTAGEILRERFCWRGLCGGLGGRKTSLFLYVLEVPPNKHKSKTTLRKNTPSFPNCSSESRNWAPTSQVGTAVATAPQQKNKGKARESDCPARNHCLHTGSFSFCSNEAPSFWLSTASSSDSSASLPAGERARSGGELGGGCERCRCEPAHCLQDASAQ